MLLWFSGEEPLVAEQKNMENRIQTIVLGRAGRSRLKIGNQGRDDHSRKHKVDPIQVRHRSRMHTNQTTFNTLEVRNFDSSTKTW